MTQNKTLIYFFFAQKHSFESTPAMQHLMITSYNLTYYWRLLSWLSRFSGFCRFCDQLEYLHRFDIPTTIAVAFSFNLTSLIEPTLAPLMVMEAYDGSNKFHDMMIFKLSYHIILAFSYNLTYFVLTYLVPLMVMGGCFFQMSRWFVILRYLSYLPFLP